MEKSDYSTSQWELQAKEIWEERGLNRNWRIIGGSPFETPPRRKHNHSFLLSNFTVQQHNDYKNIFFGVAHLSRTPWT